MNKHIVILAFLSFFTGAASMLSCTFTAAETNGKKTGIEQKKEEHANDKVQHAAQSVLSKSN